MHTKQIRLEAIKALGDWSKWLISIQAGLSAAIVAFLKGEVDVSDPNLIRLALWSFAFPIACATFLLGGLPTAIQEALVERDDGTYKNFYDVNIYPLIKAKYLAFLEHLFFLAALALLFWAI